MSVKLLIVDDHKIMRDGLRILLSQQEDLEVVGDAENGADAIHKSRQLQPDVVIMDVNMPVMDGLDATRFIREEFPEIKVIALSMHSRKSFVAEMLKAGASGYVPKEQAFEELVQSIKTVMNGQIYLSTQIAGNVVSELLSDQSKAMLTEREVEIVRLLAEGRAAKEIALLLDVSVKTIDASRRHILEKLEIDSLAELIKYAIREGLTTIEY